MPEVDRRPLSSKLISITVAQTILAWPETGFQIAPLTKAAGISLHNVRRRVKEFVDVGVLGAKSNAIGLITYWIVSRPALERVASGENVSQLQGVAIDPLAEALGYRLPAHPLRGVIHLEAETHNPDAGLRPFAPYRATYMESYV